jgi:hypothetical protein
MANFQKILRLRPEVRDFIDHRGHFIRGDVLAYLPGVSSNAFSTDRRGFRHTAFKGENLGVGDCFGRERYGIVTGASNINGFGVAGNENTLPSLLSERFGFPFANATMPGGNSRNLHSLLLEGISRAGRPPAIVVHFSGGDYSTFCVSSICDSTYGSPTRLQLDRALKERGGQPNAERQLPNLLAFTALWTQAIAALCKANKVPLVMGNDITFFEKDKPSAYEAQCELGKAKTVQQRRQFVNHRTFGVAFYPHRRKVAEKLGVPLAGPDRSDAISYVDEFHPDASGTRVLAEEIATAVEPLI